MTQNREKMEKTLELDYKGIDKQFKEQLIKTKVSLFPLLLLPLFLLSLVGESEVERMLMNRYPSSLIMIWRNIQRRSIMLF